MQRFNKVIRPQLKEYLSKNQVHTFEHFYDSLDSTYKKTIFEFCLNYTIEKNKPLFRKTGAPNVTHPLLIAIKAIDFNLDYKLICASLLHDVVEDAAELALKSKRLLLWENKDNILVKHRNKYFDSFSEKFIKLSESIKSKSAISEIKLIINIIDILTRFKYKNEHYYDYIKHNYSAENKDHDLNTISLAYIVKFIDRIDNIQSMDTELRKLINNKYKAELKILDNIESEKIKKQYRKLLEGQNSLLVDHSFSGGNRLNQIWKNTYIIIQARMFFCKHPETKTIKIADEIEMSLIDNTLKVIEKHKMNLRVYLSKDVINKWENQAKDYKKMGGLSGSTKLLTSKPLKNKEYLIFNSTLDTFSQYLLKNNREFKKLQIDKETQYTYLTLIHEMLLEFKNNSTFICDLTKDISLD